MKVNKLTLTLSLVILIATGCNKTDNVENKLPINSKNSINSKLDIVEGNSEYNEYVFSDEEMQKIHKNSFEKIKALCKENNLIFNENISEDEISITYKDSSKNKPRDIIESNYHASFDEEGNIEYIDMDILMVRKEGKFRIEDTIFNEFSNIMISYDKDYTNLNNEINESIEKNEDYYFYYEYYVPSEELKSYICSSDYSFSTIGETLTILSENTIRYSITIYQDSQDGCTVTIS